jgi:hypothetical protein
MAAAETHRRQGYIRGRGEFSERMKSGNARNRGTWHCKGRKKVVVRGIIEASTSL